MEKYVMSFPFFNDKACSPTLVIVAVDETQEHHVQVATKYIFKIPQMKSNNIFKHLTDLLHICLGLPILFMSKVVDF